MTRIVPVVVGSGLIAAAYLIGSPWLFVAGLSVLLPSLLWVALRRGSGGIVVLLAIILGIGLAGALVLPPESTADALILGLPRRPALLSYGVGLFTPRGIEVWGTNTDLDGHECATLAGEATARLACPALRLAPGEYLVDVAVHAKDGAPYDYRRKLLAFTVTGAQGGAGVYFPEHRWSFDGGARFRERA